MIRVRLFASLRELAGSGEVELDAATVGEAAAKLSERLGPKFDQLMASGSVVVDGERVNADRPLVDGDQVAFLPPVSGGDDE
ncbi:MAG TPA: MoaD/ThiS family protein [Actinomycetota bacterium]|nr:MoaD/ThiS family protein [Actinomycetota bacterium]